MKFLRHTAGLVVYCAVCCGATPNLRRSLGEVEDADISAASNLIATLLQSEGFAKVRDDSQCGPHKDNAGCDPTSTAPCCSASGHCTHAIKSTNLCATTDSHDHRYASGLAAASTGTLSEDETTENKVEASTDALEGDALREMRMALLYKMQKLRSFASEQGGLGQRDVETKLNKLAKETAAARAKLTSDDMDGAKQLEADLKWLKATRGERAKLERLTQSIAQQDAAVDAAVRSAGALGTLGSIEAAEHALTRAEKVKATDEAAIKAELSAQRTDHVGAARVEDSAKAAADVSAASQVGIELQALRSEADYRFGLAAMLGPAPPRMPTTTCTPQPPTRYCCASTQSDYVPGLFDTHNNVGKKYDSGLLWGHITDKDHHGHDKCMAYCLKVEGSGFDGGTELRKGGSCYCAELANIEKAVAMPRNKCTKTTNLKRGLICERDIRVPHVCAAQRKMQQIALLRSEVVKPSFFAPSPHLMDPKQFNLKKCCKFDVYESPSEVRVKNEHNAKEVAKDEQHSRGFDTKYEGGLEHSALWFRSALKTSDSISHDQASACLSYPAKFPRKIKAPGVVINYNDPTKTKVDWTYDVIPWLRKTPGWNDGRNWMVYDTDDPAAGWSVQTIDAATEADKFKDVTAAFRSDHAIVVKTSMSEMSNCGPRDGKGCNEIWLTSKPAKGVHYGEKHGFDVGIPLTTNKQSVPFDVRDNSKRKYLAFFKGNPSNPTRRATIKLHDPSRGIIALGHKGYTQEFQYPYDETMRQAKFGLAPEGNGLHSFRLTECMQFGTIPVMITDWAKDYDLPFADTLDWTKFGFAFGLSEIGTLADTLSAVSEAKYLAMHKRAVAVFENFFEVNKIYPATLEILHARIRIAIDHAPADTCPGGHD